MTLLISINITDERQKRWPIDGFPLEIVTINDNKQNTSPPVEFS